MPILYKDTLNFPKKVNTLKLGREALYGHPYLRALYGHPHLGALYGHPYLGALYGHPPGASRALSKLPFSGFWLPLR